MKNKNRLEIRLDPDSLELLNSLLVRTSLTKTSLIKKALKVYASTLKNGHIYTVKIKGEQTKDEDNEEVKTPKKTKQITQEEWDKLFE